MKNQIKSKKSVFPWDIKGYIKLNNNTRNKILKFLINNHRFKSDITRTLDVPDYWTHNFIRNEKIDTKTFKKIVDLMKDESLIQEIIQFSDDYGSSSIPFNGSFPIYYTPLWHFVFCLSVGDGCIGGRKKQFYWYQKPEGMKALIKLINGMNFHYSPKISVCKRGVCIPQLIRKVGSYVTGLENGREVKKGILEVSSKLGKEYEIAFLTAFFLDEAGMGTLKNNSEIITHQEGNLILLENFGNLLDKLKVDWSRNKKKEKWNIRLNTNGIIKLAELFESVKKHNITLLHRQRTFQKKVKIAKKTNSKSQLKLESKKLRTYLLNKYSGKQITLEQIRKHFKSNHNLSIRSRDLVYHMKKKDELVNVGLAKYQVKGYKNEN